MDLIACAARARAPEVPASAPAAFAVTWAPAMELPSLAGLPARFARAFPEDVQLVRHGDHVVASSCAILLAARADGASPADDRDLAIERDEGARCIVLDQLARARPARVSHLAGFALPAETLADLPPTFATPFGKRDDALARAAQEQERTLADYRPGTTAHAEDGMLVLRGDTWQARLEVLARGDFDGGGLEELLVAAHDTATQGTFDSTRLLLVTRERDGGPLVTLKRLQ